MFAAEVTRVAGRKPFIPTAAPVIVKIPFDRIGLRGNARVVPEEVPPAALPDEVVDFGANPRQNADPEPLVFELDRFETVDFRLRVYGRGHAHSSVVSGVP